MSKELEIQKRCICLRNKAEVWISEEAYQKLKQAREQSETNFVIHINEIDRDINTADIVEICTPAQMDEKRRIDRGEYQCEFGKWHNKKEKCDCFARKKERILETKKREREALENAPLSEEQKKKNKEILNKISNDLREKGILKDGKRPDNSIHEDKDIKKSIDGNCVVCGEPLSENLASVCGSSCYIERQAHPEKYEHKLI